MESLANYLAPAATMIAALMTASNLGSRVTGWGFVVFTIGSITWSFIGMTTGQTGLLVTNVLLTFVNIFGVWRWLGRQAKLEDGAEQAEEASEREATGKLLRMEGFAGIQVLDKQGEELGTVVDAMLHCETMKVDYFVIGTGGVAGVQEELRGVGMDLAHIDGKQLQLDLTHAEFETLPLIEADDWPADIRAFNKA
ncbi:PRC-barrel domain-containing protein [Erythrobacter alti]|uniref:PRC-barrel domain-containing protein n=1 Tax=Erythrobacter alti TaxID=1896145 RepID=UPI0030F3F53A